MRLTIRGTAIELDGDGGSLPVREIRRVAEAFRELFGVEPRLRMAGRFGRHARGPSPGEDPNVETWDVGRGTGSGFADVIHLGPEFCAVQAWSGLNNHRSIQVSPDRGSGVRVRFLLPATP